MRSFNAGNGRVQQLRYSPNGKHLVVDLRGGPTRHPFMSFDILPAKELVWWDWVSGQPVRRFRLRDSLYGPGGACRAGPEDDREDWQPDGPAFDVSFCFNPWRIATAWEWTNKEDGNCVYDADGKNCVYLTTPYKTHTSRLAIAPDGSSLAAATVNDMDGLGLIEHWSLAPKPVEDDSDWRGWASEHAERIRATRENAVDLFVHPAVFVFDGRFVAAADPRHPRVECWDTQSPIDPVQAALNEGDPGFDYGPIRKADYFEPDFAPHAIALGGPEHLLAVGGSGLAVGNPLRRESTCFTQADATISALAFDATAERLVAGTLSGDLELWDVGSK